MMSLLKQKQILKLTGVSRSTFYNLRKAGQWPQPIKISVRSNRWLSTEVDAMIELMKTAATVEVIRSKVRELEAARFSAGQS